MSATQSLMVIVSMIIPAHNASEYVLETLRGVQNQVLNECEVLLELSIHDDGSTDNTFQICEEFIRHEWTRGRAVLTKSELCRGPGTARNECIKQCTGQFLCFNDADDVSLPNRVQQQLDMWRLQNQHQVLVGSRFIRIPENATQHYSAFLNSLSNRELILKQYRELTLIQPTWFLSREFLHQLGGYPTDLAEDLILFNRILDVPQVILRVCEEEPLVLYRHVSGSVSSKTPRRDLVRIRVDAFERRVLHKWAKFSVWGAGRDGRTFFEFLSSQSKQKIYQFVDVDKGKLQSGFHHSGFILPVKHFSEVKPPFVVCVALGRTAGELEANIASRGFVEGVDYWHFS